MLPALFRLVGAARGAVSGMSDLGGRLSKLGSRTSRSFSRFRKRGGISGEIGRLRMRMHLSMDPMGFTKGVAQAMGVAVEYMANDAREKTVNYIMGNRKNPMNVYPKNVVNPRTGMWQKNSVARPWPQPPKSYTRPGDPISIAQVAYAKDKQVSKMSVKGGTIDVPTYVVGPLGSGRKAAGNKNAVPGLLEHGGTTRAFYRIIKGGGQILRWEFVRTKLTAADIAQKRRKIPKGAKTPVRYASWAEVNRVRRQRGETIGGAITYGELKQNKFNPGADWKGPSTFKVRGRPYVSRAWDKTKKRTSKFLNDAKNSLPKYMARNMKLAPVGNRRRKP